MKIWSNKAYELSNKIQLFDRVVTGFELVSGIIACCGRDAAYEGDGCGIEQGWKGWKFTGNNINSKCLDPGAIGSEEEIGGVFKISLPVRAASKLLALGW